MELIRSFQYVNVVNRDLRVQSEYAERQNMYNKEHWNCKESLIKKILSEYLTLITEKQLCYRRVDDFFDKDGKCSTAAICAHIRKYLLIYIYICVCVYIYM
jgi:hypothetical protein